MYGIANIVLQVGINMLGTDSMAGWTAFNKFDDYYWPISNAIGIAVMTGVAMCLLLLVYAALSFGRRPEEEKELKITIPENLDYTGLFDDLFAQYTRASELISVRTTGMGSLYNLHYHVTLVSSEVEKQFLDAIRCRNGNLDIVCGKVPQAKEAL